MRPISKIFSDLSKSVSASGAHFIITLVTTPIMTRLYAPEAYAAFGTLNMIATTFIAVGLLSLPAAYPLEKDPERRSELLKTMFYMLGILVAISISATLLILATDLFHAATLALAFVPILVLTCGARQIIVSMANERANFSAIATAQTVEPICSRGGSVALGAAVGGNPALILLAVAAGQITTICIIGRMALRDLWRSIPSLLRRRVHLLAVLRRYSDFAVYHTLSQQAVMLMLLGIQLSLVAFFAHDLVGYYILATSMLMLPANLIAQITASVVYRHLIETERTAPTQLVRHFTRAVGYYILAALVIFLPIMLYGELLFSVAFGKVWTQAGHVAGILSPAYMSIFVLGGVQSILRVTRRLKLQFRLEIASCAFIFVGGLVCFSTMEFNAAMYCFSAMLFLRSAILLLACFRAVTAHPTVAAHE